MRRAMLLTVTLIAAAFVAQADAQAPATQAGPRFHVRFSKPLAVFNFVYNLSSKWGPMTVGRNPFKPLFAASPYSGQEKYQKLIGDFDKTTLAYDLEYADYAGLGKMTLSTASLLWKELAISGSIEEFKTRAVGIIPNEQLFKVVNALTAFEPIYDELVYEPNKAAFEKQLQSLEELVAKTDMGRYFDVGINFYGSSWDNSIPINLYFYPLPNSRGFTATIFFNNSISGIPSTLADFNGLISVIFHEMYHILFDEQPMSLMRQMATWRSENPSKAAHYSFTLMHEVLATALGNGYVSSQLNGKLNEGNWYNSKYISEMAKKIYPLVLKYIESGRSIDQPFVNEYVRTFEENFSSWLYDLDFVMEWRSAISESSSDFDAIDKKWPMNRMADYKTAFTEGGLKALARSQSTKIIFISSDHTKKLALVKAAFPELKDWRVDASKDFTMARMLKDKTYLVLINSVKTPPEKLLETVALK